MARLIRYLNLAFKKIKIKYKLIISIGFFKMSILLRLWKGRICTYFSKSLTCPLICRLYMDSSGKTKLFLNYSGKQSLEGKFIGLI